MVLHAGVVITPAVFKTPGFRPFWAGQALSQVGFQFSGLAMPVVAVLLLHASEAELGYLNAANTAAFLLVGLLAGGWVDRWRKRRVMLASDVVRAAASAIIPIAFFAGHLQMWQLYVVAGILGVATVFFDVAYQSYIPILIDDEHVSDANGTLEATSQVARLGGPALAGLLLKVVSAPVLIIADAVSFVASALSLAIVRDTERPKPKQDRRPLGTEIAEGLRFVGSHPFLRAIVATTALSNIGSTILFTLEPILVLRLLGIPPEGLGLAMSVGAVGGLLGSVVAPRIGRVLGEGPTLRWMMLLGQGSSVLMPLTLVLPRVLALPVICLFMAAFSFTVIIYNVIQVSARQRLCPRDLLGRMNASIRFIVWGCMPLAALAAGWLGDRLGAPTTLWIGVAFSLAACLPLWLGPVGRLRQFPTG